MDEWWQEGPTGPRRTPGRPPLLSPSEVLTLAILAQWPRWRSERDFYGFTDAHLRGYFPNLLSHGQLNRRIRAMEPELRALQRDLASRLADGPEVYRVLDTTLVPAIVRVGACRKGLFAGQAAFGRNGRRGLGTGPRTRGRPWPCTLPTVGDARARKWGEPTPPSRYRKIVAQTSYRLYKDNHDEGEETGPFFYDEPKDLFRYGDGTFAFSRDYVNIEEMVRRGDWQGPTPHDLSRPPAF